MNLLNVNADLNRTATALERIADCLDKLCPPIYPHKEANGVQKEYTIDKVDNETTYLQETEDQLEWFKDRVALLAQEYGDQLADGPTKENP